MTTCPGSIVGQLAYQTTGATPGIFGAVVERLTPDLRGYQSIQEGALVALSGNQRFQGAGNLLTLLLISRNVSLFQFPGEGFGRELSRTVRRSSLLPCANTYSLVRLRFTPTHDVVSTIGTIATHHDRNVGSMSSNLGNDALQFRQCPGCRIYIRRTQFGCQQMSPTKDQ